MVKYGPARARYERRKRRRERLKALSGLWNVLSVLLGVVTIALAGWFIWKIGFTGSQIEQTPAPRLVETGQVNPSPTVALLATRPSLPTAQPSIFPTETSLPTQEDSSNYVFDLQAKPESISATLFKPDATCTWTGIAGQAFDLQGRPIPGITVQVSGPTYGKDIQLLSITGSAPQYGMGGYEVFLTDSPRDTVGEYQIRLVDQSGRGLSPRFTFDTSSDCTKNLVIVNFKQIK